MSEPRITTQRDKLFPSYLTQTYRYQNLSIGPTEEETQPIPQGFTISAWSPNGETLTYKENQERNWELQRHLQNKKIKFEKLVTVEATRAWVEDSFLIQGISKHVAKALAHKFQAPGFVELKGNQAIVYETSSTKSQTIQIGFIPRELGCPAKRNGREDQDFCQQHGYWTTGSAIAALGNWQNNLTIVNSRLGCNLCNNVATHPNNFVQTRNEHINSIRVTNRFSIAQWVRL
jgi:hypothetical protein